MVDGFDELSTNALAAQDLLGSQYYTLTYQPRDGESDGRFRKVHVTLRNPHLHAVTKAGFFAREKGDSKESDKRTTDNLMRTAVSTMPFKALELTIDKLVRHPDARAVEITVELQDKTLAWETAEEGKSSTTVLAAAVSRSQREDVLAARVGKYYLLAASQNAETLTEAKLTVTISVPLPKMTKSVRVVLETGDGGRLGAVDVDRKTIDAAPEEATRDPQLRVKRGVR